MGCPKLTERDYYRLHNCTEKTAYSGFFHTVSDDHIGNREDYTTYETGSNVQSVYTANSLNQYTAVTNPSQSPTYNDDGCMLTNGDWTYTWNAENRKIAAEKSDQRLEFVYDYEGRRVEKKVYSGSTGNWTLDQHLRFVYDQYEQIEELDALNSNAILKKRIHGNGNIICDIYGSTPYYAVGDANKNRTEYLDSTGAVRAHYEYSPFGKLTASSGDMADDFDFRFSSEYYDTETNTVYFNFRDYDVNLGRWHSKDPIEEEGGVNLYCFVNNNPILLTDSLGREIKSVNVLYAPSTGWGLWAKPGGYHGSVENHHVDGGYVDGGVNTDVDDPGHYVNRLEDFSSNIRTTTTSGTNTGSAYQYGSLRQLTGNPLSKFIQHSSFLDGTVEVTGCCDSGKADVYFYAFASMQSNLKHQDSTGAKASVYTVEASVLGHQNKSTGWIAGKLVEDFPPPDDTTKTYSFGLTVNLNVYNKGDHAVGVAWIIVSAYCQE